MHRFTFATGLVLAALISTSDPRPAHADLPIDPAHQFDGRPPPQPIQDLADRIRRRADRLKKRKDIAPLPRSSGDPARWWNNRRDCPATATKCATVVGAIFDDIKFDPKLDIPPDWEVVWLEYQTWPFNHSVIGFRPKNSKYPYIIDPWRDNYKPVFDAGWKEGDNTGNSVMGKIHSTGPVDVNVR